jgi:hypothetical protein
MTHLEKIKLGTMLHQLQRIAKEQLNYINTGFPNYNQGEAKTYMELAFQDLWTSCTLGHQFHPFDLVGKLNMSLTKLLKDLEEYKIDEM